MSELFLSANFDNSEIRIFYEFINKYKLDLATFFDVITYKNNTIFFGDVQSDLYCISNKLKEMFGFKSNIIKDLTNEWRKRICNKADLELYDKDIRQILIGTDKIHDLMYKVKDIKGVEHWISCQGKIKYENDKPLFFMGKITILDDEMDIDPITNLQRKSRARLKLLSFMSNKIGVIGFSLNHLSIINDSRGRDYTDRFIKDITDKICNELDNKIYLYRIEGVKFLAIINEKYLDEIIEIAGSIKAIVDKEYSHNFIFKKSINIGVYVAEKEQIISENILDVFDKIMAMTKTNIYKNDVCILSDADILHRHYLNQIELELCICVHSNFKNFRVVAQPIVNNDDKVLSAEILLRWEYNGNFISPEVFIPILERTGLIFQVGKFVFEEAARISKNIKKYKDNFRLHVNVSYIQILDDELLGFIEKTLKKYNLSGEEITLELTENNYYDDNEKVIDFANKCKNMRMMTAIDDFGIGYSSISFLIRYNANIVKIDKSLVKESIKSNKNQQFLGGVISTCKNFGMLICVEGVERREELELVRALKCDYIQGFYFFKPMELDDFCRLLKEKQI